jgi:hypothetical protein
VERVEALALESMVDCAVAHAECGQLRACDHSILALREFGDLQIIFTTLSFAPYYVVKVSRVAHAGQGGSRGVTVG